MAAAPPSAPCTESKLLLAPVQNSIHWQMASPLPPPTSASFSSRAAPVAIPCPVRAPAAAPAMSTTSLAATAVKAGAKPPPSLAAAWGEIQGAGDWAGLVDPLHPLLREEILRYAELVAVCYRAFDLDPSSKRYHRCMYGRQSLLREAGPGDDCGYEVTRYVYAAPGVAIGACSRWVGYVAVAGDAAVRRLGRRDVVVGFRGTVTGAEWAASLMSSLVPARLDPHDPRPGVKVESGFLSLYTSDDGACRFGSCSCRQQLLSEVARLVNKHKDEEMSITLAGHSMGSALALLLAYDLAELGLNRPTGSQTVPVTVYSFGGPRVGNAAFKDRFDELGVKVLRVVNVNDPVTKLPGVFLNEGFEVAAGRCGLPWSGACYAHVGVELALDRFSWRRNPVVVHDMEAYIGLLKFPNPIVGRRKKKRDAGLLLSKAAKFFTEQKSSGEWRWRDAVAQVCNLVQFLRI